jgi:hypothetical protein
MSLVYTLHLNNENATVIQINLNNLVDFKIINMRKATRDVFNQKNL